MNAATMKINRHGAVIDTSLDTSLYLKCLLAQASPRQQQQAFEDARTLINIYKGLQCCPKDIWRIYIEELENMVKLRTPEDEKWGNDMYDSHMNDYRKQCRYYDHVTDY